MTITGKVAATVAAVAIIAVFLRFAAAWRRQRRRAEAQRDRLFALSLDPLAVANFDGTFVQVNPAWTGLLGWTTAELLARPWADFVHPEDLESSRRAMASLMDGEPVRRFENRFLCRDGSYRLLSWNAHPVVSERLVVSVARDVTDERRYERSLEDSERRLRRLIDGLGPQIFVGLLTTDGTLIEANRQALEVAGLTPAEVIGKPVESTFWFAHSPVAQQLMRGAIARGASGEASRFDMEIQVAEGHRLTIDFSLQPLRDADGRVAFLVPSASDVTGRTEAQKATRRALENFEKVFRGAPEPMSISDLDSGRFVHVNDAFCRLFGYERGALVGRTSRELELWSDWNRRDALLERLRRGETIHGIEGRGRSRGGTWRDLSISADRIEFDGRSTLLLMFVDVTERRRAESALSEANERLKQLSQRLLDVQEAERAAVSRELHDEIGQALSAIKLGVQRFARRTHGVDQDRLLDCVALADGALAQVRSLALELRPAQLDELGLTAALRDLTLRLGRGAGLAAQFLSDQPDIAPGFPQATAAFRVAQEALTNVIRHAGARSVTVELGVRPEGLTVAVTDDGHSFDLEAARIRAIQGGSMGLLGMQERVALAGGELRIDARPGRGTRVEARFPASLPAERPA